MRVVQPSPGLHNITILVAQQKFVRSSIWLHMKYSIQFSGAQTKFMWSFATGSLLSYIPSQWNGYCYRFCLYIYLVYFNYLGCYCGVKQIFQLLVEKKIKKNPMKITEISFFFQIGSLKHHYLFEHQEIVKRSANQNLHHHELLSSHPEVCLSSLYP